MSADSPTVFSADAEDLREGSLVDDGPDVLRGTLTQVIQDMAQRHRHLRGQVGARVVVGQHPHQLGQHLCHFRRKTRVEDVQENIHLVRCIQNV